MRRRAPRRYIHPMTSGDDLLKRITFNPEIFGGKPMILVLRPRGSAQLPPDLDA
jgi:hypothetical protein